MTTTPMPPPSTTTPDADPARDAEAPASIAELGLLETVIESLIMGVMVLDADGRVILANRAVHETLGIRNGSLRGSQVDPEITGRFSVDTEGLELEISGEMSEWWRTTEPGTARFVEVTRLRFRYELSPGEVRRGWLTTRKGRDDAGQSVLVVSISDITEHEHERDQLRHQARTDVLTGLDNRAVLEEHLTRSVAIASRSRVPSGSVLFIDLDGFKQVNDRYGHAAGDRVLQIIGRRLRQSFRSEDVASRVESPLHRGRTNPLACRYGGDEFVVLTDATTPEAVEALTRRIRTAIADPIQLDDHSIQVDASIGSALIEPDASINEVLSMADRVVYEAKSANRSAAAPDLLTS